MRDLLDACLSAVFPSRCIACSRGDRALCESCIGTEAPLIAPFADGSAARAVGPYAGPWRLAILALKDGRRDVAHRLAEIVAERLGPFLPSDVVLAGVPTSGARRAMRGLDQAELLARAIGRCLGCPSASILVRVGEDTQRGRTRDERLAARARFAVRDPAGAPARILLVDDVLTTGATLGDAATALEAEGIETLEAWVVAQARPLLRSAGEASAGYEKERSCLFPPSR